MQLLGILNVFTPCLTQLNIFFATFIFSFSAKKCAYHGAKWVQNKKGKNLESEILQCSFTLQMRS